MADPITQKDENIIIRTMKGDQESEKLLKELLTNKEAIDELISQAEREIGLTQIKLE